MATTAKRIKLTRRSSENPSSPRAASQLFISSINYSAIKCMHQVALTAPGALEHGTEHDEYVKAASSLQLDSMSFRSNTGIPHYVHACNGMRVRLQPLVVIALNHPDMELQHAGASQRQAMSSLSSRQACWSERV